MRKFLPVIFFVFMLSFQANAETVIDATPDNLNDILKTLSDSEDNPVTIKLSSGTYEPITLNDREHFVNLIGDGDKVKIVSEAGTYDEPAAELRLSGDVKNITFINKHLPNTVVDEDEKGGYAIHLDYGSQHTTFENCKMISYQTAAVGAGIYKDSGLTFKDCYLANFGNDDYTYYRLGAIYAHTGVGESNADGGKLNVINCDLQAPDDAWAYVVTENLNGSKLQVYRI